MYLQMGNKTLSDSKQDPICIQKMVAIWQWTFLGLQKMIEISESIVIVRLGHDYYI